MLENFVALGSFTLSTNELRYFPFLYLSVSCCFLHSSIVRYSFGCKLLYLEEHLLLFLVG